MTIDRISRYNASVDGETVFLRDVPKGSLTNVTFLHSALQHRITELWKEFHEERDNNEANILYGRAKELEDIIRALGEEPL